MHCPHCQRGFIDVHGIRLRCLFCNDTWRTYSFGSLYLKALSELAKLRKQKLDAGYDLEPLRLDRNTID